MVGLENVGADLAAPADFTFLGIGAISFGLLLVFLDLIELCPEGLPSHFAVAELGTFLGGANHDAGGKVLHEDCGLHLVDVLTSLAAGASGADFDIGVGDFDHDAVIDLGRDVDGGK